MVKGYIGYVLGAGLVLANAAPALAAVDYTTNLVTNGNFEQTSATTSTQMTTTNVTGWSTTGYNFIYLAGTGTSGSQADTIGATATVASNGPVKLYGPGNSTSVNNGFTTNAANGTGPNFIAADNNYGQGAITQTVGNLTAGASYFLSFYWAAAQQAGYTGATQEQWTVSFGDQKQATQTITLASTAFSPWTKVTMYFTASSASQVLSFLATGSPGGAPPFSLLDGVSLVAAPEPATWAVLIVGLLGLGGVGIMRRRSKSLGGSAQA